MEKSEKKISAKTTTNETATNFNSANAAGTTLSVFYWLLFLSIHKQNP